MDNKLCRLYGVTTLDGLKAICGSKQFGEHINMLEITQAADGIFGFQTYGIGYTGVALKLIAKLKEFSYREYVVIGSDGVQIAQSTDHPTLHYLIPKTVVSVVDDNCDEAVSVSPFTLEELGVPNAPIPAMFKLVNHADDCVESAEVIDLTKE